MALRPAVSARFALSGKNCIYLAQCFADISVVQEVPVVAIIVQ